MKKVAWINKHSTKDFFVKDREALACCNPWGHKSWTLLNNRTTTKVFRRVKLPFMIL